MAEATFYQPKRSSPTALGIVVLLHGAAITALALAKMEVIPMPGFDPTKVDLIEVTPPPPPHRIDPKVDTPRPKSEVTRPDAIIETPTSSNDISVEPSQTDEITYVATGEVVIPAIDHHLITPPPEPVRREAVLMRGSELQPPYPSAEQREGVEGQVTVRVVIGPDGRVRGIEKVRASNDAFFRATERHALRNWRFKPATVDGRPVESRKTLNLRFEIDA
jgi:protein TonB